MNNLKFRVWCKHFNEWEKNPILVDGYGNIYHQGRGGLRLVSPESHIVQLFTGLFDKFGKEIYEGDILEEKFNNHYWRSEIKKADRFGTNLFAFCFEHNVSINEETELYTFNKITVIEEKRIRNYVPSGNRVEIIGNIFENPELINLK